MKSKELEELKDTKIDDLCNSISQYLETELNKYPELTKAVNFKRLDNISKERAFEEAAYDNVLSLLKSILPSESFEPLEKFRKEFGYYPQSRIEITSPNKKYNIKLNFDSYFMSIKIRLNNSNIEFSYPQYRIFDKFVNSQYTDEIADVISNIYDNIENAIDEEKINEISDLIIEIDESKEQEKQERLVRKQKQKSSTSTISASGSKKRGKYLSVIEFTYETMMVFNADDGEPTKEDVENLDGDCYVYINELDGYAEAFFQSASDLDRLLIENDPEKVYGIWGPFNSKEVSKIRSKGVWNEDELPECDYEPEYDEDEDYDDGGW